MHVQPHRCTGLGVNMPGRRSGFTLIELLVVIAIIAILAAILFPIMAKAKESGRRTSCIAHLKQLGYCIKMYQQDFAGCFPAGSSYPGPAPGGYGAWVTRIRPYVKTLAIYNCPAAVAPWTVNITDPNTTISVGYSYNEYINYTYYHFMSEAAIRRPSTVFLLGDAYRFALAHDWDDDELARLDGLPSGMNRVRFPDKWKGQPRVRHSASNILFCDLHVQAIMPNQFKAKNYPGDKNLGKCYEWPVMYPAALPFR